MALPVQFYTTYIISKPFFSLSGTTHFLCYCLKVTTQLLTLLLALETLFS